VGHLGGTSSCSSAAPRPVGVDADGVENSVIADSRLAVVFLIGAGMNQSAMLAEFVRRDERADAQNTSRD
jgi:hypothetical protein